MPSIRRTRAIIREAVLFTSLLWFLMMCLLIFLHDRMLSDSENDEIKLLLEKKIETNSDFNNIPSAKQQNKNISLLRERDNIVEELQEHGKKNQIESEKNQLTKKKEQETKTREKEGKILGFPKINIPELILRQKGNDTYLESEENKMARKKKPETKIEKEKGNILVFPKMDIPHSILRQKGRDPYLGYMGQGVRIIKNDLTDDLKEEYEKGWTLNSFNQLASDYIPVERELPDNRNQRCRGPYLDTLPKSSVIICFHNEAWSVLLRSVHSVLNTVPEHFLEEIILVDDFSDMSHLKDPLDEYMSVFPKVKIIRTKKREGLMRARILGYEEASAPVLTFLDSHIECFPGWMEPLLERIHIDKTTIVTPVIDMITDSTFSVSGTSSIQTVGGLKLEEMRFTWRSLPRDMRTWRDSHPSEPLRSPTMAGGLFAVDKDFFTNIGTYDDGMVIWGGENLEISLRVWMCGGKIMIHPCSHVGHVFRTKSPYKWLDSYFNVIRRNAVRTAEVWLDDYKQFYYERLQYKLGEYGDVSARKELRKRLQCKDFEWYIKNVFPDLVVPPVAVKTGEIRSGIGKYCLDNMAKKIPGIYACHGKGGHQFWALTHKGFLRTDSGMCLTVNIKDNQLNMANCLERNTFQKWSYDNKDKTLRSEMNGKCLEISVDRHSVYAKDCIKLIRQVWIFWTAN